MRLTWLADVLRAAGLRVVEVDGWETRGSDSFDPEGVTWHATAGSRKATAQGEVNVLLRGSTSAPPPIAQLMIWRDGTVYVVAAGRCNHNLVGWGGLNRGLGNSRLLGIEMANDNKGEPWPDAQLDAARRATAAIMRRLDADPMRRLAGHYEHQPAAGRPAGQTSTKTDPRGVDMTAERRRVAALMTEGDEMALSDADIDKIATRAAERVWGTPFASRSTADRWPVGGGKKSALIWLVLAAIHAHDAAKRAGAPVDVDEQAIAAGVAGLLSGMAPQVIAEMVPAEIAEQVVDRLLGRIAQRPTA